MINCGPVPVKDLNGIIKWSKFLSKPILELRSGFATAKISFPTLSSSSRLATVFSKICRRVILEGEWQSTIKRIENCEQDDFVLSYILWLRRSFFICKVQFGRFLELSEIRMWFLIFQLSLFYQFLIPVFRMILYLLLLFLILYLEYSINKICIFFLVNVHYFT